MSNTYNINYESSEVQPMSQEKASAYRLWKTVNKFLEGSTMFFSFSKQSAYTYEDFVLYIGCDATNYFFDTRNNARNYTWIAKDDETAKFSALFTFKSEQEKWTLNFSGSTNLMTEPVRPEDEPSEENGESESGEETAEDINVDEILGSLKEDLKKEFEAADINVQGLAGTFMALMGAGLFAAGLSTMASGSGRQNSEVDLSSVEPQMMSDKKASEETLKLTHSVWLDGKNVFGGTAYELLTYENFKERIGCDATVYYYDKIQKARVYTWIAEDNPSYSLCIWFKQKGENWNLYMIIPQ